MAFIFGVATEAELYKVFRDFISGRGRPGHVSFTGTGTGVVNNLIYPEGSVGLNQTITLTCVATAVRGGSFSVVGGLSGVLPDATVGQVYKHPLVEFYLDYGNVDFQIGDTFTLQAVTLPAGLTGFDYIRGMTEAETEVITLTCTTAGRHYVAGVQSNIPAVFSVQGSESGPLPDITQGVPYSIPQLRMQLSANNEGTNQYQLGDQILLRTTRNPLRAVGQQWEILRQTPYVGSQFGAVTVDTDSELILRGPGLAGADTIYYGMTRSWSDANAAAWWTHFGMTGYIPSMTISEQSGVQGGQVGVRPVHTFWSLATPYTIIADGRCFKLLTRANIYYSQSFAGLYLPTSLPKYIGYPYLIGGTGDTRSTIWSALSAERSSFWSYQGGGHGCSCFRLDESMSWFPHYGFAEANGGGSRHTPNRCDPYSQNMLFDLRANLDGSVPLFQVQLSPNRGFIPGVYALPGRDGRAPEEILDIGGGRRMLVTQNHHRSGFNDFCAFELE